MSYQVLARKWRPRLFSELVGQTHVVRALSNALDQQRLHHAYLFTGTRGVGKTTLARILAKSLNCERGVSSTPCGCCSTCISIDEGRFVDLLEVDAASRTKVDQTRELLENVPYAPVAGRYKVYLIDEVHMFSDSSFNALLKTLEEPPPHVKFLLATTDPQKVPVTVLSRCLQFNLRHLGREEIEGQLRHILQQEGIEAETSALTLLARAAAGSMRDALSLLDQAIAFGVGRVGEADVRTMLGVIPSERLFGLLSALSRGDGVDLLGRVAAMAELSPDFPSALQGVLQLLHRVALQQAVPGLLEDNDGDLEQVTTLAQAMTPEDVQLYYQIGLLGQRDLPFAPDLRSGFEMVLLRMLAFRPDSQTQPAPSPSRAISPPRPTVPASSPPAQTLTPAPVPQSQRSVQDGDWHAVVEAISVGLGGMAIQLAEHCVVDGWEGDTLRLVLLPGGMSLASERTQERLAKGLSEYYGKTVRIKLLEQGKARNSQPQLAPAERKAQERQERQQQAERDIQEDGYVQALQAGFDAQILGGSIRPIDKSQ